MAPLCQVEGRKSLEVGILEEEERLYLDTGSCLGSELVVIPAVDMGQEEGTRSDNTAGYMDPRTSG